MLEENPLFQAAAVQIAERVPSGLQNGIAPLKDGAGQLVYDNSSKVALLNQYFSSVFTVDNGVIDDSRLG